MPRPDSLPRFNAHKKHKRYHALDSADNRVEQLSARLREAERVIERLVFEIEKLTSGKRPPRSTRNRKRKPPEAGLSVPAIPPRGPLPMQGGAEAPLEFD